MSYLLRFEGVNLENFIYDTNDLSTIRGGGLLLLDATKEVEKIINIILPTSFETITKGASWALFKLETDESTALKIKQKILEILCTNKTPYRHATFVVDVLKSNGKYKMERKSLLVLNRWQQMQAPSLSIPNHGDSVCDFDKVRPAKKSFKLLPAISRSVRTRKHYGSEQKQGKLYTNIIEENNPVITPEIKEFKNNVLKHGFTNDLHELSADGTKGILNGKIAIIYLDGNKFGQVVDKCKTEKEQHKFDERLRTGKNAILIGLLEDALNKPDWLNDGKIRLETLLWGGDELIWVVPAWLGWETLCVFYQQSAKIRCEPELLKQYPSEPRKLTFAAGLVFCHHNSPIQRTVKLAKALAEIPKNNKKYQNTFAYQILESFDHSGMDIEFHRKKRLLSLGAPEDLLVKASDMQTITEHIVTLKTKGFPKRKCYQIMSALLASQPVNAADKLESKVFEDILDPDGEIKTALHALQRIFGGKDAHWLHITDLWDYINCEASSHA